VSSRFTTNPVKSRIVTPVFFTLAVNSCAAFSTSGAVRSVGTISTELHDRRGIEEVEADHAGRTLGCFGQRRDRERRGVGGEDRLLLDDILEPGKQATLLVEILDDRLDDEVALGEVVDLVGAGEAAERRVELLLGAALLFHVALQRLGDLLLTGLDRTLGHLHQHGVDAGARSDLRHARAHLTAPDHGNATNVHWNAPLRNV
jgi:hypothetical protein